jgi:hypothetical protein
MGVNNPPETRRNPHPLLDSPRSRTQGETILLFDNSQRLCEYEYQVRDMNYTNLNSEHVAATVGVVCERGTVAAEAAAGDTMSSEVRVG